MLDWTLITVETLQGIDFDRLLSREQKQECIAYGEFLSREFECGDDWSPSQKQSISFVKHALMMTLRPNHPSEPFGALVEFANGRSALPSDFPKQELIRIVPWMLSLKNPVLRARLLDITWVQARYFQAVSPAVHAYLEAAAKTADSDEWLQGFMGVSRALRLSASIGKGGDALKIETLQQIITWLSRLPWDDPGYLTLKLIKVLVEFKEGDLSQFASKAWALAKDCESKGEYWRAKDYSELAAECHRLNGDNEASVKASMNAAECLVREARSAMSQPGRGMVVAATLMSDAVEIFRQIPGGKDRAAALHAELLKIQQKSRDEYRQVSTRVDIQKLVEQAIADVSGKSFPDAVANLCAMSRPPFVEELKKQVFDIAKAAPLQAMMPFEVTNLRGRVVAIVPGLSGSSEDPGESGLRGRLFKHASLQRSIAIQASIDPARSVIFNEHSPCEEDIQKLIKDSLCVPNDHQQSIARALLAGFEGDWIIAAHIVPSQFEAMVRHVVELAGGATSMLEPGGVQPERPLKVLLETKEANDCFGEAGTFELLDLLADSLGANLRNEIAHGLLGDSGMDNFEVRYAWWLMLRYCLLSSTAAAPT